MARFFRFAWLPLIVFVLCFFALQEVLQPVDSDTEENRRQVYSSREVSFTVAEKPYFFVSIHAASEPFYWEGYADFSWRVAKTLALHIGGKADVENWLLTFDSWYKSLSMQERISLESSLKVQKIDNIHRVLKLLGTGKGDTTASWLAVSLLRMRNNVQFDRLMPTIRWNGTSCRAYMALQAYRKVMGRNLKGQWPQAIGWSLSLGGMAWLFASSLGFMLGVYAITPAGAWIVRIFSFMTASIPSFAWGVLFLLAMLHLSPAVAWPLHDPGNFLDALARDFIGTLARLSLPALCMALMPAGYAASLFQTAIQGELLKPYVQTAKAKGLSAKRILLGHVIKNASFPLITSLLGYLPGFLAGSLVIEQLFGLPGVGRLLYQSFLARDFAVLLTFLPLLATFIWLVWILADLLYALLDPRINQ
jgi:peptide/nickel transport system permease protein